MTTVITTSIFDIFKIGPGPSSSHTIGPMKAARAFLHKMQTASPDLEKQIISLDVSLYGSLSATGLGHGTHKAVLGGLLGWTPEGCDADRLLELLCRDDEQYEIAAGEYKIPFRAANIHFAGAGNHLHYQNTLFFEAKGKERTLITGEYYSIGGGFIREKGEKEDVPPELPHSFSNMTELSRIVQELQRPLHEIILENEAKLSNRSRAEIEEGLDRILAAMKEAVENGLARDGILPGPIGLQRKAQVLYLHSQSIANSHDRFLAALNAYALAASEENAAGRKVVTAPTSGSAGIIPGIVTLLDRHFSLPPEQLRHGLVAAAAIAFVARHNASIAGAEVGCQGEVGVASAMAAAFLAHANGASIRQVENAAEIALEHHLGLTCDPIDGYVQIPCIERNAMGAVSAYNSYILATVGEPLRQKISFDQVVEAMRITGKEMSSKYKETAQGGLAVSYVHC
ncbi:MAG: L-serine ammonia-lyase [Proteobacteria bacterium]|nr:L-serine ammonia-lyase [Pseudomonadota bacterium]MBU1138664.1 L-serine ammonia-lyase [Pseudomonadota bacterium]MBU1232522.1 L-serine ammonia-lyase [Pseudomonadota bacterium]MBU1420275.1 L-serine ammonia-lyase [Pseudomonadota bacterium]MBU1455604.1 L-serine ammonia-lyase [Pseudomonadota bacterium]